MTDDVQGQNAVDYFFRVLQLIKRCLPKKLHDQDIRTINGNTQKGELSIIRMIKDIFIDNHIPFKQASSQQPYDFRIPMKGYEDCQPSEQDIRNKNIVVGNDFKTLLLEIKKTESNKVMCNDTFPTPFAFYIIIRKNKKRSLTSSDIQGTQGEYHPNPELLKNHKEILLLREGCKKIKGEISMYPRSNFSWDIRRLFSDIQHNTTPPKKLKMKKLVRPIIYEDSDSDSDIDSDSETE